MLTVNVGRCYSGREGGSYLQHITYIIVSVLFDTGLRCSDITRFSDLPTVAPFCIAPPPPTPPLGGPRPLDSRMWCAMAGCFENLKRSAEAIQCYHRAEAYGGPPPPPPLRCPSPHGSWVALPCIYFVFAIYVVFVCSNIFFRTLLFFPLFPPRARPSGFVRPPHYFPCVTCFTSNIASYFVDVAGVVEN